MAFKQYKVGDTVETKHGTKTIAKVDIGSKSMHPSLRPSKKMQSLMGDRYIATDGTEFFSFEIKGAYNSSACNSANPIVRNAVLANSVSPN